MRDFNFFVGSTKTSWPLIAWHSHGLVWLREFLQFCPSIFIAYICLYIYASSNASTAPWKIHARSQRFKRYYKQRKPFSQGICLEIMRAQWSQGWIAGIHCTTSCMHWNSYNWLLKPHISIHNVVCARTRMCMVSILVYLPKEYTCWSAIRSWLRWALIFFMQCQEKMNKIHIIYVYIHTFHILNWLFMTQISLLDQSYSCQQVRYDTYAKRSQIRYITLLFLYRYVKC